MRKEFRKTLNRASHTSRLNAVFALHGGAALNAGKLNTALNELVLNNHVSVFQKNYRKRKLTTIAKILFCFRCTLLYYSLGAETSGLPAIFEIAPDACVRGPRVS